MDRRLIQFLAVAETGQVSRAAESLNLSQPTISVNLRKLEEDHGVPLFQRSSRGLVLTEFGQILYEHVRTMKRLDDHARAEISARKSGRAYGLRIGFGYAWWPCPMREVVQSFKRDQPDRSVLADVASSLDGLRKVLSGDIALFLGTEVGSLKPELSLRFERLFKARHAYFARAAHPLAGRSCSADEIGRFERIDVVPVESGHLGIVHPHHQIAPFDGAGVLQPALSTNSMTVCIDLLAGSDAILGYPRALETHFRRQDIVPLELFEPDVWDTIGVYSLNGSREIDGTKEIVDRIRSVLVERFASNPHIEF